MHGLPEQTADDAAVADLSEALALSAGHISWYQLTIERNTRFWDVAQPGATLTKQRWNRSSQPGSND